MKHVEKVLLKDEMAKRVNVKGLPIAELKMKETTQQNNQNNQSPRGSW